MEPQAWLDLVNLPSGRSCVCDICGEPLQFLLQVFARSQIFCVFSFAFSLHLVHFRLNSKQLGGVLPEELESGGEWSCKFHSLFGLKVFVALSTEKTNFMPY